MRVNFNECFWKIEIKGVEASGICDSTTMPIINVDFGGADDSDTFEYWTKKRVRDRVRIAKYNADPQVNCCAE